MDGVDEDEEGLGEGEGEGAGLKGRRVGGPRDPDALPPETKDDLKPFPLNRHFFSQPVLSEELRDVIYDRVARQEQSVRDVSVALGVAMERVAAVVRLKEVERRWVNEVCVKFLSFGHAPLRPLI